MGGGGCKHASDRIIKVKLDGEMEQEGRRKRRRGGGRCCFVRRRVGGQRKCS